MAEFGRSIRALVGVRLREFFREPEAVFWTYGFPIVLAAGLGIAFRDKPVEHVAVGVAEWSAGAAAAATTAEALGGDSAFAVTRYPDSSAAALALRTGRAALVVVPRADGGLEYRYDDTRPEAAAARLRVDDRLQRAAGRTEGFPTGDTIVRERGSRYIDFLLPGLIALNLMGSGVWGTGFTIVDARRRKLLKRLLATPMSRAEFLASFPLAQLLLLVLEVGSILLFGVIAFGVPVRGSLATLALVASCGSLTFGALGLLAAARPTTIEGASGVMNLMLMPMWVLSGVFFSSDRFPALVQPVIKALPLTALVDALRLIMLEGAGLAAVAGKLAVLGAWLVVAFLLALRTFRWQ